MKNYEHLILNELLNKYEKSKLSKEGSTRNIKISIKANHKILKDYWSEESYLFKDQINMILDNLVKMEYVDIRFGDNKELEFIDLNIKSVDKVYKHLKRINPKTNRTEAINFLRTFSTNNPIILRLICALLNKLERIESVQSYFNDLDELSLYIKAIEAMTLLEEDTLKRNFSKKVFNDSKMFEKIENKVIKLIREFSDEDFEDNDEVLTFYHIVNTPTFAYIKGNLEISVKDQIIDLSRYGHEIALSSSALLDLEVTNIFVNKVITIENLTTFVSFNNPEYIVVYLGGFHNSVKRELLRKIYAFNNKMKFYHFGDIDAGGLMIFNDLVNKTNIDFIPYLMDVNTLDKYKEYWVNLTKNDIKRLNKLIDGRFNKLIKFMLLNNCKLEQEAIE
jgi:hypothetical protein